MKTRRGTPRPARRARGFSLLSVLVAMVLLGVGLLAMGKFYVSTTVAGTQNQNVSNLAPFGNAFWGILVANPGVLTSAPGTYTSSNIGSAPAPLQPWLNQVTSVLPSAQVTVTTGADAASGNTCSTTTGCTVQLSISWTPANAGPLSPSGTAATRTQTFYYQIGLS